MKKRCENCTYFESGYYSPYCMWCNPLIYSDWEPMEEEMEKEFTKADLKNRMVVEYRDGKKKIVVDDILMGNDGYAHIRDYNDDLTNPFDSNRDIIKVFDKILYFDKISETYFGHLMLWERKETKELTLKEIEEKFGVDEVKIIDD